MIDGLSYGLFTCVFGLAGYEELRTRTRGLPVDELCRSSFQRSIQWRWVVLKYEMQYHPAPYIVYRVGSLYMGGIDVFLFFVGHDSYSQARSQFFLTPCQLGMIDLMAGLYLT